MPAGPVRRGSESLIALPFLVRTVHELRRQGVHLGPQCRRAVGVTEMLVVEGARLQDGGELLFPPQLQPGRRLASRAPRRHPCGREAPVDGLIRAPRAAASFQRPLELRSILQRTRA